MADYWIINYKERFHEDDPNKLHTEEHSIEIAVDIDSVVTIKHCDTMKNELQAYEYDWFFLEVDNGWTYKAQVVSKVDDDKVLDTLVKAS